MKKVILSTVFITIVAVFGANCQRGDQSAKTIFRIINVSVPDSVVFALTEGNEIEAISVSLVSGEQNVEGGTYASGNMSLRNGKMYITSESVLTAKDFNLPAGFKANKIKFDTGDTVLYYDIASKKWTEK
jgi:hypothetical protein